MKTKHKNLWLWGGAAAALVAATYALTRSSSTPGKPGLPASPARTTGSGIPVFIPDGSQTRLPIEQALSPQVIAQNAASTIEVLEANGTTAGYHPVSIDFAKRVVQADRGDGKPVPVPFDSIVRVMG